MKFIKPENVPELLNLIADIKEKKYFLAGGTDINVQLKNGMIKDERIIFINHLLELKGISEEENDIVIGALTSYKELLYSELIQQHLPFLQNSLTSFASPLLQVMATLGGNLANGSPTADVTPPLLVLDARIKLLSKSKTRIIPLTDFYTGYKKFNMQKDEIIAAILIEKQSEKSYKSFHQKVGSRKTLTIAKVGIAGLKKMENDLIKDIKLAVGSLNEFPRRLPQMEGFLIGKSIKQIEINSISNILQKEITPISDLRSDKEYRFQVCANLIWSFLES